MPRPDRRPALLLGVGSALAAALLAQGAFAQTFRTRDEGINVGRFILHPSVAFEYTKDDNVYNLSSDAPSDEVVASAILAVRPRILVDLPLGENRIRWVYSPLYQTYTASSFEDQNYLSHFFDFEAAFESSDRIQVTLRHHLVHGTLQVLQIEDGREAFGLTPFDTRSPEMEITLAIGSRQGFSLIPRYSQVTIANRGDPNFFRYGTREVEGRYNYQLSESALMYGYLTYEDTIQDREQVVFGDVSVLGRTAGIGLRRKLNDAVVTNIVAGYQKLLFAGTKGKDYAGPVLEAQADLDLGESTVVSLSLIREAYQSFFANNNYYLNNEISLHLIQQVGAKIFWTAGVAALQNDYADPLDVHTHPETPPEEDVNPQDGVIDAFAPYLASQGVRRRDKDYRFDLGLGVAPRDSVRFQLGYTIDRRESNIEGEVSPGELGDPFKYRSGRFLFRIEVGWM